MLTNAIPDNYEGAPELTWAIVLAVLGFAIVFVMERFGDKAEK